ncbi:MAG: diguanylate cyclase (GGDEF)-like protein [Paraglaciecola sp.]|jgi:diguanylate cyclase (GGDEF)-like protein
MQIDNNADGLSLEELRALVPEIQQITDKFKRTENIQKSLFDISELASSVNELSRLYPAIHEIIGCLMNAQNFFVAFYGQETTIIDFVYFVDQYEKLAVSEHSAEDLKDGATSYILQSGKPLFLTKEHYLETLAELQIAAQGPEPVDWIGVPLKRGSQVIGAMVVQSYDDAIRYTPEDLEVLLFVSQHIVNCVDRVKSRELTEKTIRERTKQLREMNEELQDEILERQKVETLQRALFEISELSASVDGNMESFYAAIHYILSRLVSAPNCYIAMLNDDASKLEFPYYTDELTPHIEPRELGLGLTEYVIRTGRAALINPSRAKELSQAKELNEALSASMLESKTSWLGSPLIVKGEISGVIAVQIYDQTEQYSTKDLEFLRFVSNHIAVALERKRSSDAIQVYNQQLEDKVKERTDALNKANVFLQKQIEERKKIQRKLVHDAHHDALTSLANRVLFNSRLELALANKLRYPKNNFAVIFIDLDRFKQINDSLGHHAGDQFLIEMSKRIAACVRGHDLVARLGGDEFVILLDNFEDTKDIEEIASRVIKSAATLFELDKKEVYSGASLGIACIENGYQSADEIIRNADAAMYQAKAQGRGRYVVFDMTMREKVLEELEIETEFRAALKLGAFECYSQPVINMHTKQHLYEECCIRWEHSKLGEINREQYGQIAEQSGLTVEMDTFMLTKACEILHEWQSSEGPEQNYKLAINLSIHYLTLTKLAVQLIDEVKSAGVDPNKLILEFDENDLHHRSQFMLPAIKQLKRAGITLILDNFGSGLASLSYLYAYPFDYVKIDPRFIKTLPRSARNTQLIQSVISISSHLKFNLIAQGIETDGQYQALNLIGCEFGQGNFIQAPKKIILNKLENPTPTKAS